jgi:hypothetical protein
MDFITNIRNQVNSVDSAPSNKFSISDFAEVEKAKPVAAPMPEVKSTTSLDFFLNELESRNFFNNKLKEQQRLEELENVKNEVVTKLKELHIENKLNPAFIKELLAAIEFTYKKFKEDQNLKPENFYQVCLSYIDSRRPSVSDYRAHVDF